MNRAMAEPDSDSAIVRTIKREEDTFSVFLPLCLDYAGFT